MRVLLTADTVGGVWTFALELARALASHDVEIALATMGAPLSRAQRTEVAGLGRPVEVFESNYKLEWMDDPWADVGAAGEWLLGVERQVRPDVVHLNGTLSHGALPWRAPVLVCVHSCVLSWWQAVRGEIAPAYWDCYRQHVTHGLRAADLVLAPTRALLERVNQLYGPLPRTGVVPNGRSAAGAFTPFCGPQREPCIVAAGRLWDEAKNVGALARIASRLPWPVCVAGDDLRPGDATPAQAFDNVRCLGRLDPAKLADLLSRAGIYALPARYEPFGLSALEAALSGCALVLGDIASLREVWGDGEAALFVPPDDPDALEAALRRLIERPDERNALARRARARALSFSPERMAQGYLAAYAAVRSQQEMRF